MLERQTAEVELLAEECGMAAAHLPLRPGLTPLYPPAAVLPGLLASTAAKLEQSARLPGIHCHLSRIHFWIFSIIFLIFLIFY